MGPVPQGGWDSMRWWMSGVELSAGLNRPIAATSLLCALFERKSRFTSNLQAYRQPELLPLGEWADIGNSPTGRVKESHRSEAVGPLPQLLRKCFPKWWEGCWLSRLTRKKKLARSIQRAGKASVSQVFEILCLVDCGWFKTSEKRLLRETEIRAGVVSEQDQCEGHWSARQSEGQASHGQGCGGAGCPGLVPARNTEPVLRQASTCQKGKPIRTHK